MKAQYLDAVYGLGRLIAGRSVAPLEWRDPRLLGWSNLLATAVWPALDDETRTRFGTELEGFAVAHALNTDRNAQLLLQLERVVTCLNQAGIKPLVLKGAAHLATGLWPTPGSRLFSDIDLLIEAEALEAAFSALEEYTGTGPQDRGHPEINVRHKHMMPVIGAGGPAAVELHHAVYAGAASRLAPAGVHRERARPIRLGEGEALILSPTDRVLTAMLHGPVGNGTWLVLTLQKRDMLDIHFLDAAHGEEVDWLWIQFQLASTGWVVALQITNAFLERFTGMAPPFERPGPIARLDAARWVRQMEHNNDTLRRAGEAANHLAYTYRGFRFGGEPRRRILANLARPDTYRRVFRHYVLGRSDGPS